MPKVITDFTIELVGGETATFAKAWLYGRIAYVPHRAGSGLYAELYEVSSGALIASWDHQPINGKTAQIKECAGGLDTLDWQPIVEERDRLPHDIIHPFIERANALIRKAGGRSMLQCPACSEKYRQYLEVRVGFREGTHPTGCIHVGIMKRACPPAYRR